MQIDLSELNKMDASKLRELILQFDAELQRVNERYYSPAQLKARYGDKSMSTIRVWLKRAKVKTKKMIFDGDQQASVLIPHSELMKLERQHLHDSEE